jgi:hypothetical protein
MDNGGKPAPDSSPVHLTLIEKLCGAGSCPTVYRTERGTLVVQGNGVAPGNVDVDVPAGEALVEVPEDLLLSLAEHLLESRRAAK